MIEGGRDSDDVLLVISHPFGDLECSLTEWMVSGPGPRNVRPVAARSRSTGAPLALTVIPLAYRNDRVSRALIAAGKIESPWRAAWNVDDWGMPPCEIGGPRSFGRSVPNPERMDRLARRFLDIAQKGQVSADSASLLLARVPEFGDAVAGLVRRLAAEARWEDFDTVITVAGAAGLVDVGPVLCEVLESDAGAPRPGRIVDVLAQIECDEAAELFRSLLGRFVYACGDLPNARRCLHALATAGRDSRVLLTLISWTDEWPEPIRDWAIEELEATGSRVPPPL
ncbi:hypothetical protein [Dactylosporangium sp. NPDC000521]|uniref:hypothetical protein n=1 Tax=Dactylosporangium sp. NPDC000521 TaxID=3363975 RepID=UPI0036A792AB